MASSLPPSSPSSRNASAPSSPVIGSSTIASSSTAPAASSPGIPLTLSNRVLWSGELSVKPSSFLGKWKTRFFVLRPFTIDIYEDLVGLFNALPVASIPLIHINGAIASTDGSDSNKDKESSPPTSPRSKQNKKVGLVVPTLSKVWTLMTSHIEERDEWITQLNSALSLLSLSSSGRKTTSAATPPLIKRVASSSVDENDALPNSAPSDDSHLAAALNDGITDTSSSDTVAATAISASNIQIPAAIINDNPSVPTPEDIIANSLSIGHPHCDNALAYEALSNYNAAIVHWQKANQESDKHPLALWRIANRLWWGWGCKRDPEVAKKLWELAAQKGQVGSLARCYQFGLGGKAIDERKAYSMMFEFATKNNDVDSQCVIGTYYDHGTGVSKDSKLAISYYQRAASKAHAPALFNLAICYMTGVGVSQNALEGCFFFKKATESNHGAAAYNLGLSYKIGAGVKKNDDKSKEWITKANEWGHVGQYSHMGKETEDSVDLSLSANPALQGFAR